MMIPIRVHADDFRVPRLRALLLFGFLFMVFSLFSYAIAGGGWKEVAAIGGAFVGLAIVTSGRYILALVWMVGAPTLFVFPDRFLNAIPAATSGRLLFVTIMGLLILGRVFKRLPPVRIHRVEWLMFAFLGIAGVSLMTVLPRESFDMARINIAMYLQGYMMPLMAFYIARRIDWSVAGVFLACVATLQQFFDVTFFNPRHLQVINEGRASGTLGSSHEFGATLTALAIVSLYQALHLRNRTPAQIALFIFATGAILFGLLLTKTRGPWLGCLVGLVFVFVCDPRSRRFLGLAGILGTLLGIVLVPIFVDPDLWSSRIYELSPIYNRLTALATSVKAIVHNPLLGMGFTDNAFDYAKQHYLSDFGPVSSIWARNVGVPHNEFLNIGLLTGATGLVVYLLLLTTAHRTLRAQARDETASGHAPSFAVYANAILLVYVFNALFIDFSLSSYFPILVFFLIGTAVAMRELGDAAPSV